MYTEKDRQAKRRYYLKHREELIRKNVLRKKIQRGTLNPKYDEATVRKYGAKHPLRAVWAGMKARCYNENSPAYENYGGRGIVMCDRWRDSFIEFCLDVESEYQQGLSIDRIDNNGIYELSNIRWADDLQQCNNRRSNRYLTLGDTKMTIAEWSRYLGVNYYKLYHRLTKSNKSEEDVLREFIGATS